MAAANVSAIAQLAAPLLGSAVLSAAGLIAQTHTVVADNAAAAWVGGIAQVGAAGLVLYTVRMFLDRQTRAEETAAAKQAKAEEMMAAERAETRRQLDRLASENRELFLTQTKMIGELGAHVVSADRRIDLLSQRIHPGPPPKEPERQ